MPIRPSEPLSSGQDLETTIAPFYRAIGRATARWQHVEASLFVLAHAIIDFFVSLLLAFR
jgi:hypothetical protein